MGFSFQGQQEDDILPDGTDMRGWRSVEGRIRLALDKLVGSENYENIQVSSRTDRGVHAIKNTMHLDVRGRQRSDQQWDTKKLLNGINYFLSRQGLSEPGETYMNDLRILEVKNAPSVMRNAFYDGIDEHGPPEIDWNARFSATERTYVYRILQGAGPFGLPFEWDRSWKLRDMLEINTEAMNQAAKYLVGPQDVSSFRGKGCERASPVVNMSQVSVTSQPYGCGDDWNRGGGLLGLGSPERAPRLILIKVVGDSFVYRQVRNIVGCLVQVGMEKISPQCVQGILQARDRRKAPAMAPAHGLFLVDVKHGEFIL